jgi:hypothetical protein
MERVEYHKQYNWWPKRKPTPPIVKIDSRSLEAQGIDRAPQQHQGVIATQMERRGAKPDRTRIKKIQIPQRISEAWQRLEEKIHFIEAKLSELYRLPEEVIRKREAGAKEPKEGYSVKAYLAQFEQEQEFKTEQNQKIIDEWKVEKVKPQETEAETKARIKAKLEKETPEEIAKMKAVVQKNAIGKALALAAIPLVAEDIHKRRNDNGFKIADIGNRKPSKIVENEKGLDFLNSWKDDNGNVHLRYKKYATAQQAIIDNWNKNVDRSNAEQIRLAETAVMIEKAKKGYEKATDAKTQNAALSPVLQYVKEQEAAYEERGRKAPELYAKIKTATTEKLKTSSEFREYRVLTAAIGEIEAERDAQRKTEHRAQRLQQQKSKGWSR